MGLELSAEQMALLAIAVFGFIALFQAINTARNIKRTARRRNQGRQRRLVSGDAAAKATAVGLVEEVKQKHPALAEIAQKEGKIPQKLEEALEEAQLHYRQRVESRHKALFYTAVNTVILGKTENGDSNQSD